MVDLQRWGRNKRYGHVHQVSGDGDEEVIDDFDIKTMANLLGRPLVDGTYRYYRTVNRPSPRITTSTDTSNNPLTRIFGLDGSTTYPKIKTDDKARARQQSCFMCRRYYPDDKNTQWKCKDCRMPLCQIDRTNNTSRNYSCVHEHKQSGFDALGCWRVQRGGAFKMPKDMILYKMTRSEQQRGEDKAEQRKRKREEAKAPAPAPPSKSRHKRSK